MEIKSFIPPDYSKEEEDDDDYYNEGPTDDDEDDVRVEIYLDNQAKEKEEIKVAVTTATPFGQQGTTPTASATTQWKGWSQGSTSQQNQGWTGVQQQSSTGSTTSSSWGQYNSQNSGSQKLTIDRSKKVVFCSFLDCIAETWSSKGIPGFLPRDIYDLLPRFDVWQKLEAINPEQIIMFVPKTLIPDTNGMHVAWNYVMGYYGLCVSSFLKKPFTSCRSMIQNNLVYSTRADLIRDFLREFQIPATDACYIGVYSGLEGQSNIDLMVAQQAGVDYIDLKTLLTNMI